MVSTAPVISDKDRALGHAAMFRSILFDKLGVPLEERRSDKRTFYELATHGHGLETRHNAVFQSACQVIDDLVAALKGS
jgi:hypothetical protein